MKNFAHSGRIHVEQPLNLSFTLESGQTFLWDMENQDMFKQYHTENPVYTTARRLESGAVMCIRVSQTDGSLHWESTHSEAPEYLAKVFRLDKDYEQIRQSISENDPKGVIKKAIRAYPGLRVVNEPLFPTLISFICSTTAELPWIHELVQTLCTRYGDSVVIAGDEYAAFPTVSQLTNATEADLREQKFGIRAERISKTVAAIRAENPPLTPLPTDLDEARTHLQRYFGVGRKIANCTLLYGREYDSAVPVDTWIDQAIEQYYPEFAELSKDAKSRKLEDLYGEYAGHAQLYLFHYMRMNAEK